MFCVYRYGAAPREMPRSGSSETAFAVSCFEVCKTSKLHSTRSVLPRQGHAFYAMESFRKGNGFILFASAKRTKKQLLGRAKSCQWQVFVRRRPPKQGELRTDVSKATMFQGEREQKHAQRAAPTGASFLLVRKFPKGKRTVTFCGVQKVTQKARGASPATPVQIAGRNGVWGLMTGFQQVTGFAQNTIMHRIDGNDLNRCELQALHKRICGFVRTRSGFF